MKEATARIKINRLLEAAGWRFFQQGNAAANIRLEPSVTIESIDLSTLGDNFEQTEPYRLDSVEELVADFRNDCARLAGWRWEE